jgi:putative PIN family toxin of toxin-antitoxin system
MKVLLDANIYLSYLLARSEHHTVVVVVEHCLTSDVVLVAPEEVLAETLRVLTTRPYFQQRIAPEAAHSFVQALRLTAFVPPVLTSTESHFSRDRKDDYLLAYALMHSVDFLVTGDEDLVVLGCVGGVTILTPLAFRNFVTPP